MVIAQDSLGLNCDKLVVWLLFSVFIFDFGIFLTWVIK